MEKAGVGGAFGAFGGQAGEAFNLIQQQVDAIRALRNIGIELPKGGAVNALFEAQVADIFKQDQQKAPQFKGLTQAWKDAVTTVDKKDNKLKKLQMDAAKALIGALKGAKLSDKMQKIIDVLEERLVFFIK